MTTLKLIDNWKREADALQDKIKRNPMDAGIDFKTGSLQRLRVCIADIEFPDYQKGIALNFYNWVSAQVVAGRTTEKLWIDYVEENKL